MKLLQALAALAISIVIALIFAFILGATAKLIVILFNFGWNLWNA